MFYEGGFTMKRRIGVIALAVMLITTMLAGCATKTNDTATEKEGSQTEKVKLRFASWDSAEDLDMQQNLVDQFNEEHDNIEVVLEAYGDDFDTKISAGMGSNDAPDIMYMWNYPAYYEGLEPLDAYLEKEGADFKAGYYDALWDYNSMNGEIYGMPVGFTTHCVYYNKDIFDQAGLEYPQKGWTWDDLIATATTITEKADGVKGFSYQLVADPYDFEMFLWSNDTAIADENGVMEGNLNSDQAIYVFEMYQQMQKDGIAIATEKGGSDEMRSGKTGMFIYGSWAINTFKEDNLNFGIVELPSFASSGKDSVSILSSSGISMSKDSKYKDEAWEFIKYWTGEELNKARIEYELPVLNSVVESENIMEDELKAPFYSMLEQSAGYVPTSFVIDDWSRVCDNLELAFERIFNPSTLEDAKTVLDEAVKQ